MIKRSILSVIILSETDLDREGNEFAIFDLITKPTPDCRGSFSSFPDKKKVYPPFLPTSCDTPGRIVSLSAAISMSHYFSFNATRADFLSGAELSWRVLTFQEIRWSWESFIAFSGWRSGTRCGSVVHPMFRLLHLMFQSRYCYWSLLYQLLS